MKIGRKRGKPKPFFGSWKVLIYKESPWMRKYRVGRNSSVSEWLRNKEGRKTKS